MLQQRLRCVLAAKLLFLASQSCHVLATEVWNNELERTKQRTDLLWDWGHTFSGIAIDSQPLNSLLSSILNSYRFTLPVNQLERAISYRGASSRLRHVIGRMINGHNVHVGLIGGSISWGHGVSKRGETDWFSHVSKWLISAFPRSNFTARNGCVPGVPSAYMILCLEQSLDYKEVELVFVEFNLNDGREENIQNSISQSVERLIRRLLVLPKRPAVVFVQSPSHGLASYPPDSPKFNPQVGVYRLFYETMEDMETSLGHYYDVQMLSVRTALYRLAVIKQMDGFLWEQTFVDIHPGDQGHKIMADLVVYLMQQTAIGMLLRPFSQEDEEAFLEPLPEPMFPGNKPPDAPMCVMYDEFRQLVVEAQGWQYLDEGSPRKPKPGFIATVPDSRLVMRIDTNRTAAGQPPTSKVTVWVQHLKSYQNMGVAEFRCIAGCTCDAHQEDAHINQTVSQLYVFRIDVTQSAQCDIEVKVLPDTSSGEHKFKIAGVVVSEGEGKNYLERVYIKGSGEFGFEEHNGGRAQLTRTSEGLIGDSRRLLRSLRRWLLG